LCTLIKPNQIHLDQGRGQCQERTLCQRGCPFGGYFSSNSSTIPWALKSGHCTLRPHSVVESIIYDDKKGKATGVRVIDANTKEAIEYYADVIFVNAAALNSNLISCLTPHQAVSLMVWVMIAARWVNT
jgi:choline dehydrogenase-like flavoprotein